MHVIVTGERMRRHEAAPQFRSVVEDSMHQNGDGEHELKAIRCRQRGGQVDRRVFAVRSNVEAHSGSVDDTRSVVRFGVSIKDGRCGNGEVREVPDLCGSMSEVQMWNAKSEELSR